MENQMQIQWFPGHMAKTRRLIQENIKLVDLVVEICDARIPFSSRNPEMENLTAGKPRMIILNKSDLADPAATKAWSQWYAQKNITAFGANCKNGAGLQDFQAKVKRVLRQLVLAREEKGMAGMGIRIMVVGIPNVGKSSFINRIVKNNISKVEDKPWVTRGKQWLRIVSDM